MSVTETKLERPVRSTRWKPFMNLGYFFFGVELVFWILPGLLTAQLIAAGIMLVFYIISWIIMGIDTKKYNTAYDTWFKSEYPY